jgi:hypothetical protein
MTTSTPTLPVSTTTRKPSVHLKKLLTLGKKRRREARKQRSHSRTKGRSWFQSRFSSNARTQSP